MNDEIRQLNCSCNCGCGCGCGSSCGNDCGPRRESKCEDKGGVGGWLWIIAAAFYLCSLNSESESSNGCKTGCTDIIIPLIIIFLVCDGSFGSDNNLLNFFR